jgi:predicted nucleotidyltransferase
LGFVSVTWETRAGRAVWSGRTLDEWLEELVGEVVAAVDPKSVWLYGSLARGEDDAHSDVDLLVVLDDSDERSPAELQRAARTSVSTPVPYDVSFTTSAAFVTRSRIAGTIERAAARDGRVLYERA